MSVPPPPPRRRAAPDASDAASSSTSQFAPPPPRPDPEARAARRAAEQGRGSTGGARGDNRRRTIAIAACVVVVLVGAGVAVLASSGGSSGGPQFKASTSVKLTAGTTTLEQMTLLKPPQNVLNDARNQILSLVGKYVDDAIVHPLRSGAADDTALAAIFDPGTLARLAAGDRAILVDEGLPKALGGIAVTTPPVAMSALVDTSDKITLVTATVNLKVTAQTKQGVVKITRSGTLVFALDASGAWKITGWTLHVDRTGPGVSLPTTTAPAANTTVVTT